MYDRYSFHLRIPWWLFLWCIFVGILVFIINIYIARKSNYEINDSNDVIIVDITSYKWLYYNFRNVKINEDIFVEVKSKEDIKYLSNVDDNNGFIFFYFDGVVLRTLFLSRLDGWNIRTSLGSFLCAISPDGFFVHPFIDKESIYARIYVVAFRNGPGYIYKMEKIK